MVDTLELGASWRETIVDIDNLARDRETMAQIDDFTEQIGGGDTQKRTDIMLSRMRFDKALSHYFLSICSFEQRGEKKT